MRVLKILKKEMHKSPETEPVVEKKGDLDEFIFEGELIKTCSEK